MARGVRDNNNVVVMLGEDPSGNIAPVKIDNTTGYVLMAVNQVANVAPTVTPDDAPHDDNNVPAMLATIDGTDTPLTPLIDNRNGYLWITQA